MKKIVFITVGLLICGSVFCQLSDSVNSVSIEEVYYEKGCKKFSMGQYPQALYWFEKGIEQGPMYEENYYGASKVYFLSTEMVWAVMYGELFMILSQNDSLQAEISQELFEAYFDAFTLNKTNAVAKFDSDIIIYSDSFERRNKFPQVFDNLMSESAKGIRFIDISTLITIRQKFLSLLKSKHSDFHNTLFAYWDKIIASGHWQAYNYWLFAYGNRSESATWARENRQKWNDFLSWKDKNIIQLSDTEKFSRYLME